MKIYNHPHLDILCLDSADVITTSVLTVKNQMADDAEFDYSKYIVDDSFWA